MREWDLTWRDVVDPISQDYVNSMRRMVMASINWIENHPDALPEWREEESTTIMFSTDWENAYEASNEDAAKWFRAITSASTTGRPSSIMMGKAIAGALLLKQIGWQRFDQFMREGDFLFPPTSG